MNDLIRRADVQAIPMLGMTVTAIDRAIAAIPAADPVTNADSHQRVTVNPLGWVKHPTAPIWRADTAIGSYKVFTTHGVTWDFDSATDRNDRTSETAKDADAAFAAAQADYEARILSALDAQPDTSALADAAMREAAGETAAKFLHDLFLRKFPVCSYHSRNVKDAIIAIPTTFTTADLLAQALALPQIARLVEALEAAQALHKQGFLFASPDLIESVPRLRDAALADLKGGDA